MVGMIGEDLLFRPTDTSWGEDEEPTLKVVSTVFSGTVPIAKA